MDILTMEDLKELTNIEQELFISIYMPTFRKGVDVKQNRIILKKMLRKTKDELYNNGFRKAEVEEFLAPTNNLLDDTIFLQNQSDSLVIFLYKDGMKYYRLPFKLKESVSISNKLYIKPLLPLFSGNGQFFLLALSKNQMRFFKGTRQNINEIKLKEAPESMKDMQIDDDPKDSKAVLTSSPQSGFDMPDSTISQGQANEDDYEDNELLRYFRAIDEEICKIDKQGEIPLVLAGVEYLIPIYRDISKYPHIVDEFIKGNPEALKEDDLHGMVWEIVEPIFNEDKKVAEEKFKQYSGQKNKLSSTSLNKIIPAAYSGQIESLFIADGREQWGKFDHSTNKLKFNDEKSQGDEDLLEYVSMLTLSRGGKVFSVNEEEVPDGGDVAAVLRY